MVLAADCLEELRFPLAAKIIGDAKTEFNGVSTDTRSINKGDLFIALSGDKHDGHVFADQAVAEGAAAVVVREEVPLQVPQLLVDDTGIALGRMGALSRLNWQGQLLAITGSNGKTTVKEMIGTILKHAKTEAEILMTEANHNNTLGVPMTLLKLTEENKYAVIEMGTDSPGEIPYSAALTKPSVAILTNITMAHFAGFGSRENIAREKGSLLEHLIADGLAIINGDDDFCPLWESMAKDKGIMRLLKFGYGETCDLRISNAHNTEKGVAFNIVLSAKAAEIMGSINAHNIDNIDNMDLKEISLELPVTGLHNCLNATAAFAACCSIGLTPSNISDALAGFENLKGRLNNLPLSNNCLVLDDSYNANPASMIAALNALNDIAGDRKRVAIIGDMFELGDEELAGHRQIGEFAGKLNLDGLLACGSMAEEVIATYHKAVDNNGAINTELVRSFATATEANEYLDDYINQHGFIDTAFLVKGSRGMTMDRSVNFLMGKLGEKS